MNVKELILSQPAADIAAALIDRLDVEPAKRDKVIRRITALIDSLRGMEPEITDYMLLGVYHMYDDREFLDANLYRKSELTAELAPLPDILAVKGVDELTVDEAEQTARTIQLPQGYVFELSPWCEVLGYEVNIANAREVGVDAFCAAVLYEMTFFGFDEKWTQNGKSSMILSVRQRRWTSFRRRNAQNTSSLRRRSLLSWAFPSPPRKNGRKHVGRCAGRCCSTV